MIRFSKDSDKMLLTYQPSDVFDPTSVAKRLLSEGEVTIRRTFTFDKSDLIEPSDFDEDYDGDYTFVFGVLEGDYYKVVSRILGLKHDIRLWNQVTLRQKTFIANRDISVFRKIDELIEEPIIIGGDAEEAISCDDFNHLLANFPTTTELQHYAKARVCRVLKDYFGTMSDAETQFANYLSRKKSIRNHSKIDFISEYEPHKYEYVRDEIIGMLHEIECNHAAYREDDWQRQIVRLLLLIFPKYIAVLEKVSIKDFYPKGYKDQTKREIDIMLVDANGSVDIIEVKRPEPHQLLSKNPGSRGNYTPGKALSEAVMQAEKYLFHLSKWGAAGEKDILDKKGSQLPPGLKIRITNPKALLILGRDKDFDADQKLDFEIIKRKYSNIADIMTYDDLSRRLDNILFMLKRNLVNNQLLGSEENNNG